MNENEIYPADPTELTDNLDDVEGHGLKEVAAGLGAAAVLAGGAAGATQLASTSASVHPSSGGGISVTIDDPIATADRAVDSTIATAQADRDAAIDKADARIDSTLTTVDGAPGTVNRLAGTAANDVHSVKTFATGAVKSELAGVNTTTATEVAAARGTTNHVTTTADTKLDHATTTASTTVTNADRKVATILSVVTTTAADGVHTAKVTLKAVDAGAGANTSSAGGWVLIKAGDKVLAQVHMENGTATATWTMPLVGGHDVTVSYTGDTVFAPSFASIAI